MFAGFTLENSVGRVSRQVMLVAGLVLGMALVGCKRESADAAQGGHPPAPVGVATSITADVPMYIDQIGRTVAAQTVSIVPQVDGKILATHVEDGGEVKKGDLLFEIDPRPFQAALDSANATLAQRVAEQSLAETEFRRAEDLLPKKAVSQLEYDQRKSALAVAAAQIQAAQADVENAQLNLEYAKIYSPIDGRAGARLVDAGNVVKANDKPLLVLQQLDPIYAEFTVTENDLGTVRKHMRSIGVDLGAHPEKGLAVQVDVPGDSLAIRQAFGGFNPSTQPSTQPANGGEHSTMRIGTLTFLDNTVQGSTGTIRLRATLANKDRYFWPGQFVNVRVVLAMRKNAVLVPVRAQQVGQTGPYVYVVKQGEVTNPVTQEKHTATVAELRPIKPGQRHGEMVVVDSGLEPGEQVVIVGHMMIQPGGEVAVMPAAGSASPDAAGPQAAADAPSH